MPICLIWLFEIMHLQLSLIAHFFHSSLICHFYRFFLEHLFWPNNFIPFLRCWTLNGIFLWLNLKFELLILPLDYFDFPKTQLNSLFHSPILFFLHAANFHKPLCSLLVVNSSLDFTFLVLKIYYESFLIVRRDWSQ